MNNGNDGQVHGTAANGDPIVRLDRAGKWYRETPRGRRRISVFTAAELAVEGTARMGLRGGSTFDRTVERIRRSTNG